MRQLVAVAAVVFLAGCSFLPGKQFVFGFPAHDAVPELHGVLTDTTGAVTTVTTIEGMDPAPPIDEGMMTLNDGSNSVIAYWLDACDDSVAISVTPEGGVTITVATKRRAGACDLVGIRRYVRIQFASSPDPNRTTIHFER